MSKWKHVNKKACNLSDIFRKNHIGNYNAYSSFYIWYIVKCRWLWICCKVYIFICMSNQIGINETRVRTAPALCTKLSLFRAKNSLYTNQRLAAWPFFRKFQKFTNLRNFTLKFPCTEIEFGNSFYHTIDWSTKYFLMISIW